MEQRAGACGQRGVRLRVWFLAQHLRAGVGERREQESQRSAVNMQETGVPLTDLEARGKGRCRAGTPRWEGSEPAQRDTPRPHPYLVCVRRYLDRTGGLCVPQETDHTLPTERKYGVRILKE